MSFLPYVGMEIHFYKWILFSYILELHLSLNQGRPAQLSCSRTNCCAHSAAQQLLLLHPSSCYRKNYLHVPAGKPRFLWPASLTVDVRGDTLARPPREPRPTRAEEHVHFRDDPTGTSVFAWVRHTYLRGGREVRTHTCWSSYQ